jgi:hypothetical protein
MTPHSVSNPYQELGRQKKATKLADHFCGQADVTESLVEDLELATPEWWNLLAEAAGCKVPSTETIALTISLIRQRCSTASDSPVREQRPAPTAASKVSTSNRNTLDPRSPAVDPFAELEASYENDATDYAETGYSDPFEGIDASPSPWKGLG